MKKWLLTIICILPGVLHAQIITTFAGTGSSIESGDGGLAIAAGMPNPADGTFDKQGNYYFADLNANVVRKIDTAGIITTVAGNSSGAGGFAGDGGLATDALLSGPGAARLDSAGNIYIADLYNSRIRKVSIATGIITTIAGNGSTSYSGDGGPATSAGLWGIQGICLDKFGNLYIADGFNYRVRKVNPAGTITTIAGTGTPGYAGESTLADTSMIPLIGGMCTDTSGILYLTFNSYSPRVVKITSSGIITTVAGNGITTYSGDGMAATDAQITPIDVDFDSSGNLFIADKANDRVYKVTTSGILYNVAGNGVDADSGDGGIDSLASLAVPVGVALDGCGNLYITTIGTGPAGSTGKRIRKVTFNTGTAAISLSCPATATAGSSTVITATVTGTGSYNIKWYKNGMLAATTTSPSFTYTMTGVSDTITATVFSNGGCFDSVMSAAHIITIKNEGIQNLTAQAINIYPNPAHNSVTVTGNISSISISNAIGQQLLCEQVNGDKVVIDIAGLPPGMYMLVLTDDKGMKTTHKIIKQ